MFIKDTASNYNNVMAMAGTVTIAEVEFLFDIGGLDEISSIPRGSL